MAVQIDQDTEQVSRAGAVKIIQPILAIGVLMILSERMLEGISVYDSEQDCTYDQHDPRSLLSMVSQAAINIRKSSLRVRISVYTAIGGRLSCQSLERQSTRLNADGGVI
jgi:hypothetical protein